MFPPCGESKGRCAVSAEVWRPVVGFEHGYEVSDCGRVRSIERVVTDSLGRNLRREGRVLAQTIGTTGYFTVSLGRSGGTQKVHRLVLEAFRGPSDLDGCHNDGNKLNNALDNLRWDTRSENNFDMVRHGKHGMRLRDNCPRGHELRQPNLVTSVAELGWRDCRACSRARSSARYHRIPLTQELADSKYREIVG